MHQSEVVTMAIEELLKGMPLPEALRLVYDKAYKSGYAKGGADAGRKHSTDEETLIGGSCPRIS